MGWTSIECHTAILSQRTLSATCSTRCTSGRLARGSSTRYNTCPRGAVDVPESSPPDSPSFRSKRYARWTSSAARPVHSRCPAQATWPPEAEASLRSEALDHRSMVVKQHGQHLVAEHLVPAQRQRGRQQGLAHGWRSADSHRLVVDHHCRTPEGEEAPQQKFDRHDRTPEEALDVLRSGERLGIDDDTVLVRDVVAGHPGDRHRGTEAETWMSGLGGEARSGRDSATSPRCHP